MDHLTEQDYRELIDYIVNKLSEFHANDIIRQIKELKTVCIIEEAPPENEKSEVTDVFLQTSLLVSDERYSNEVSSTQQGKPGKKLAKDAVSAYRSRPMTGKEMYLATIDIIETYLITVPEIIEKLAANLGTKNIIWETENEYPNEKASTEITMLAMDELDAEIQGQIRKTIAELREART